MAMVLTWSGLSVSPEKLKKEVYTPKRKGSLQHDLKAVARRYGRLAYEIYNMQELLQEVAAGHPVIVLQNLGLNFFPKWHYAVVVGYDLNLNHLILHSGGTKGFKSKFCVFYNTWKRSKCWGLVVLKPGVLPATAERVRYLEAVLGLEQAKKWNAAAKAYQLALFRWPNSITAVMGRGNCLYRLGNLEDAEKVFRGALEIHPNRPELYNNLAQVLMEMDRYKEALGVSQIAVSLGGAHKKIFIETLQEIKSKINQGT